MWIQVKYSENESFYIETPSNTKISELTQTILRYFNLKNQLIQLFTLAIEHAQQHKKDQNYYQPLWKLYELYLSDEVLHEPVNVNAFSKDIEKIKTNDLFNELVKSEAPQSAISKCELFFVKKKLESDKMLSDYAGKIEKTKIIISIDESTMSKIQSVPSNINLVIPPSILKPNKKRKADELNESFFAKRSKPNKQEELPQKSLRVPESDILTESILSLIGKSEYLKNKLRDERLQKVILEIDSAVNRERKLDEVMRNDPDFVEFVNEILYLMGVRELDE